ncbi:MAG: hypothetical protein M1820_003503 [Bogoriella megaspora]|nr:MAG: hypothetical protein M1820_003503 [Bogoriella megaspora]
MESSDRRHRQIDTSNYGAQRGITSNPSQYAPTSAPDRFRQSNIAAQSPGSGGTPNRQSGSNQSYGYGYGDNNQFVGSSLQQSGMQFTGNYGEGAQRSQQQPQQYQYGSGMMYNPQQQQSQPQQSYDSVQQYQPPESVALGVLSSQLEVPRQYFVAGEGGPTSAPAATSLPQQQHISSQYPALSQPYQQAAGRASLTPTYGSGMSEPAQASSQGAYAQQGDYTAQTAENWTESAYENYQRHLREAFQQIRDGRLVEAAETLLRISSWLLQNAETLGLVRDEPNMHEERLKLWSEFNTCWLAVLQKQKEMTEEVINTGQHPLPPQNLIEYNFMERMGRDLIRLCDSVEKHGLVDYQMGVWEEQITVCM